MNTQLNKQVNQNLIKSKKRKRHYKTLGTDNKQPNVQSTPSLEKGLVYIRRYLIPMNYVDYMATVKKRYDCHNFYMQIFTII